MSFRLRNGPFEILKIANNTFNAQAGDYADSGLTVVNSTEIDKDPVAAGSALGNLIFRDNEYDDNSGLAGTRMLKLRRTMNLDLENNNIQGSSQNTAIIELTDSVAQVGKNFAIGISGPLIKTLDAASRVFFKHNNINFGNVVGLINKDTGAGIVRMTSNQDRQVFIFGQLGDPGGMTTFQFDIPDNQPYTILIAEWQVSPPNNGYMTRGQKVLVVARNVGGGIVKFSDQFKMSGLFTSPGAGKSRAILFEYVGTVDYPQDPQNPKNADWNGYMVERWCSPADVDN